MACSARQTNDRSVIGSSSVSAWTVVLMSGMLMVHAIAMQEEKVHACDLELIVVCLGGVLFTSTIQYYTE